MYVIYTTKFCPKNYILNEIYVNHYITMQKNTQPYIAQHPDAWLSIYVAGIPSYPTGNENRCAYRIPLTHKPRLNPDSSILSARRYILLEPICIWKDKTFGRVIFISWKGITFSCTNISDKWARYPMSGRILTRSRRKFVHRKFVPSISFCGFHHMRTPCDHVICEIQLTRDSHDTRW